MTTALLEARLPQSMETEKERRRLPVLPVLPVAALLREQQTLTAVERFSQLHDAAGASPADRRYSALIPLLKPRPGEQYAFEVDLDACTACKACVAACHSLNGLDEDELWRTTGLLHGGSPSASAQQTVTTSCHHCLEPACMLGCPTQAYEKDPVTGIVRHLDDQCFGCQYCTLMCPYDAPKYSKSRGIVRKCDMCSSRLAQGEAPACVQACPNEAIAIRTVQQDAIVETSNANGFLPGAPAPDHTLPTTIYKTLKKLPNNMLPADFYSTRPEHSHMPLVVMLTLVQLSVGAFALELFLEQLAGAPPGSPVLRATSATALALTGLGASVFHLGRPWLAWRAVLGLRTSWMSREALAFGLFVQFAIVYAALTAAPLFADLPFQAKLNDFAPSARGLAAGFGLVGVFCSIMVYVATRRVQWSGTQTGVRFFGTTLLLGSATTLTVSAFTASADARLDDPLTGVLLWFVMATSAIKLMAEGRLLLHARDRGQSTLKRVATVMLDDLTHATRLRFVLGAAGGLLVPVLLMVLGPSARLGEVAPATVLILGLVGGAEFLERYLFFRAAPASRMPGGLR